MSIYKVIENQIKDDQIRKIVIGGVVQFNNRYLMLERKNNIYLEGFYEIPNGALEYGETIDECINRVIKERIGLYVKNIISYLGHFDYISSDNKKTRQYNFLISTEEGEFQLSERHSNYKLCTLDECINTLNITNETLFIIKTASMHDIFKKLGGKKIVNIEKEVRYLITDEKIKEIINTTTPYKDKQQTLDITFGYNGFESLAKFGFICRIRQKHEKTVLEIKKKISEGWLEQEINLVNLGDGINFFKLLGMTPYMYLKRNREVRKYKDLKIFIDEVDVLGNFVEIEYQDSTNAENELNEFLEKLQIENNPQPLYGDIIKERLKSDNNFSEVYTSALEKTLKEFLKENYYEI